MEVVTDEMIESALATMPAESPPALAPINGHAGPVSDSVLEHAGKYVDAMPPAIAGENGSKATFAAACSLVLGFDLSPDAAFPILAERFNPRCAPPWSDAELRHKLDDANKKPGPRGKLLEKSGEAKRERKRKEPLDGKKTADQIEPATFAAEFLAERASDGLTHLPFWRGSFRQWHDGRYLELEPSEAQAELVRSINRAHCFLTTNIIGNIMAQVKAQAALPSRIEPPAWLEPAPVDWPASEVLATRRELVHIPSLIGGQAYTIPATPAFFSTVALDYDFAADAPVPVLWLSFLRELWGDDQESIDTLQEICGYALTPDTRHQKIFMLIGPPRGGKGVIARVLNRLVGPANVAAPTLASLETNFGLSPLLGKSLAIIADARLSGKVDQSKVVERLLSISGEDSLTADRKYREPVTGKIPARLVIISNELPRLAESSGALANRMIVLRLTKSFLGREDTALTEKLLGELPGILLWAIEGWRRLRDRGRFIQPEAGRELAGEMKDLSSPVGLFLRECCQIGPQFNAAVDAVYVAWCDWCKASGRDHPGTKQTLGRDLRAAVPSLRDSQPRDGVTRYRRYEGIGLVE
jgi:putative DNA primase/helicase